MGKSVEVLNLPERFLVPQDVIDTFQIFEAAANEYVRLRSPANVEPWRMVFRDPHDIRWVGAEDVAEMSSILGSDQSRTIPMRRALNALRNLVKIVDEAREALRLPKKPAEAYYMTDEITGPLRRLRWQLKNRNALIGELVAKARGEIKEVSP